MTPQAEQLVLQYLSRVAEGAYGNVPARRRAGYLAELRSRVDRACAAAGAQTSEDVRRILRDFGRPEDLVARELAIEGTERPDPAGPQHAAGSSGSSGSPGSSDSFAVSGDRGAHESAVAPRASADAQAGAAKESTAEARPKVATAPSNRPVRLPPPWRGDGRGRGGGRGAARPQGRSGASAREPARGGVLTRIPGALRRNPPEALAIVLYLLAAGVGIIAAVWLVGAVIVLLSRVWTGMDKAAAVGVPILATLVGMALWESGMDHIYIDQIIWKSLGATGVDGLRLAALGAAAYLVARLPQRRA